MTNKNTRLEEYEKKEKQKLIVTVVISLLFLTLAILLTTTFIKGIKDKNEKVDELDNELIQQQEEQREILKQTAEVVAKSTLDTTSLNDRGQEMKLLETKQRLESLYFEDAPIVRYYKREADNPEIGKIIQNLGFYLNIRPVDNDLSNSSVNTIWYGDSVAVPEVIRLTHDLIESGIEIKRIMPFKGTQGYTWKNKSIEIGYAAKNEKLLPLTIDDLEKLKKTSAL